MRRSHRAFTLLAFLVLTLMLALPAEAQAPAATPTVPAHAPSSKPSTVGKFEEARTTLAKASTLPGFAARLGATADAFAPEEALSLLTEFCRAIPVESRLPLLLRSGDLALLLGRFMEAGDRYQECSALFVGGRDSLLLLKAARCRLAAGESGKARDLAALVLMDSRGAELSARARLVGAWALLLEGRLDEAASVADEIAALAGEVPPALADRIPSIDIAREARFLEWAAAPSGKKTAAASLLTKEFPFSPEAQIATGSIAPAPLPHWYLGGLAAAKESSPDSTAVKQRQESASSIAAKSPEKASNPPSIPVAPPTGASSGMATAPLRLQVGYFSKEENAKRLQAELVGKGIPAKIESKPPVSKGKDAGTQRWSVIVEGGSDPERMKLKLKDSGYESYPLE